LLIGPDGEPRAVGTRSMPDATAIDEGAGLGTPEAAAPAILGMLDFTVPEASAWWRDAHRHWFEDGVDAFECEGGEEVPDDAIASNGDSGSRLHNVYPLLYHRCVFEASERFAPPGSVPAVLASHAGWAGAQRLPFGFAGDAQADWEGLAASIRGALAWGMSGGACHGLSVGAHHGTRAPAPELLVRWLQAGVFASHLRLVVPRGGEPLPFGAEVEAIVRKWIALRYRLIPYLEHTIAQATRTGLPVMRAMPLAFPESALVRNFGTQFMCGNALLVAPIVRSGGEVDIALPAGGWYDLNTRLRYAGPRVLRYTAQLDQFPVFGREGYALPLGHAVQHTGEADPARPLDALWLFGTPRSRLDTHGQARIEIDDDGTPTIRVAPGVDVQGFGDGAPAAVHPL
ncbi:MAG: glycoside hydrolase family 31 protein, partial [Casimicrobiaceae bacterium]